MKTSAFRHAHTMTGSELIGVSHAYYGTYCTTADQIQYKAHLPFVQFSPVIYGLSPYAINIGITIANDYAIAIGHYTAAFGPGSVAVGAFNSAGFFGVSIGNYILGGDGSMAIGGNIGHISNIGPVVTAIGCNIQSVQTGTVAIGYDISGNETHCIGIGYHPSWYGSPGELEPGGMAIGSFASASNNGGLAIGKLSQAQLRTTAIGYQAHANSGYATLIGYHGYIPYSCYYSTAIGSGTTARRLGTAFGHNARSNNRGFAAGRYANSTIIDYGISIGASAYSGTSRFHIGSYSYWPPTTAQDSMSIGYAGNNPLADGEWVFGSGLTVSGLPYPLRPATRFQKFRTHTQAGVNASASWTADPFDGWSATFTNNTPGSAGNDYIVQIVYNAAPNVTTTVSLFETTITIVIGTDAESNPNPFLNTLLNLSELISANPDLDGFTFSYTMGFDDYNFINGLTLPFTINFANGADVVNGVFQTGAFSGNAVPAIPHDSFATVYGRVTGADQNFTVGNATFSLAPTLFYCDNIGTVTFINEPVFTLENGDATGSSWSAPTLISEGGLSLRVDAPTNVGSTTIIYWIAHLTFDASF